MLKRLGKLTDYIIFVLFLIAAMTVVFFNATSKDKASTSESEVAKEISLISSALVYNMDYKQLDEIISTIIDNRSDIQNVTIIDNVSNNIVFSYSLNREVKAFTMDYMQGHSLPIVYHGELIGSVSVEFKPKPLPSNNNFHTTTSFIVVFFLLVLVFLNLVFYSLLKLSISGSRPVSFGSKKFIYLILSCMSVFILMTVLGGYFILEKNRGVIENRVEKYLQKNITDFNRDIKRTKNTLESIYRQMTNKATFQQFYSDLVYAKYSDNAALYDLSYVRLLNSINQYHDFGINDNASFMIMDVEGRVIVNQGTGIASNDIDKTMNSAFIGALAGNAEFLTPKKKRDKQSSQYHADLYFSYPMRDHTNKIIGVFFSAIPKLPFIYYDVSQYNFGLTGELIAINKAGEIVSKCRFPTNNQMNCGGARPLHSLLADDEHSLEYQEHLELFNDYRGEQAYVLTAWHDDLNLMIMSKMDSVEVLDSFYEFQRGVVFILVVMSIFTLLTTMYTLFLGKKANDKLIHSNHGIIKRLGHAAEFKDNDTAMHIVRMSHYAKIIAITHGCKPDWVELLFNAAPMHDIGKIGVPDHILQKPGKLTPDEWLIMRQHPEFGARIIGSQDNELLTMAHDIAIAHHEKWDGSGYPYGIKGENIPISARIIAIADVFDALTSERTYKKAWSQADAEALIISESGKHFDPSLVDAFVLSLPEIKTIRRTYVDNNEE